MSHESPTRPPNHLAGQTSPYLLQHLHNPVDWYPWGEEAIARARREDKPIFLSIGYAACHWCHVMERESFESESIAAFLNEHFVPVKVDREERPDLDEIYMTAVQLLTGQGGWPLSVFLTPSLEPFYGGTYFPPDDRYGRPGFDALLRRVQEVWSSRRGDVARSAAEVAEHVRRIAAAAGDATEGERVGRREMAAAAADLAARFDPRWGGFGPAPKFPPDGSLGLLLREHARTGEGVPLDIVRKTLDAMALGGMYDHVGGGFARYSTDERWLVPHFEKMLYNQALLVPLYVDAWLLTREDLYRRVALETLDFVRREMTDPAGGFWSSIDADSEGHEGRFYVFTPDEVRAALGSDGDWFCEIYGITEDGNFEGKSIPNLLGKRLSARARETGTTEASVVERLAPLRARLLAARSGRPRPATDDKVLTAWNGLMISACARAYEVFGRPEDLASARRAADFVLGHLWRDGRLLASFRAGKAHLNAYLDDHAFLARGLLDLYEASFERRDLDAASELARAAIARYEDRDAGGFFFTSNDHETLLARSRSHRDGALPAGSAVMAQALLRLALHLGAEDLRDAAHRTLAAASGIVRQAPGAFPSLLAAADMAAGPFVEIAVVGDPADPATRALLAAARRRHLPNRAIGLRRPGEDVEDLPLLAGKAPLDGRPAAYLCRDYACEAPTTDPSELVARLER